MAKAVLVMDMPEQVCQKCTLCYETENDDEYLCCAVGKLLPDGEKPDWCPLLELPDEKCGAWMKLPKAYEPRLKEFGGREYGRYIFIQGKES